MIFLADATFENCVAQITYMKNMSRKSKIQKVAPYRLDFGDNFRSVLCRFADRPNCQNVQFTEGNEENE
jgi:hypothetical protein